ncbi:Zn-dependent hydrolase [Streptomyces paradoxus]|uniref:N-carbamoyl-L-amino-acid hydrolase n=1 Tax=Streptomyces paradoxus TaxID=66375 RepID=A0A7W9TK75_9ACTN|nr:M20 family metallo-hydrolase [Streptomyces paradoxus]MBB6081661.1 N-carbamoyl-L-amino-acid hydrolase [Streptomyces paradoxus]
MPCDVPEHVTVDGDRLWRSLMELAEIGAYEDEQTGLRGVRRLALTDADAEGRRKLVSWMEEAGLTVRVDAVGNIYGHRAGTVPDAPPVMIGSHIDSVATAGAFDGCLGVLGGLEIVRTLNERGITTRRPLMIAAFSEEEGVRFGTDMLGSAVAAGRIPLEEAYALTDADGLTFGDELARIGFAGPHGVRLDPSPYAYVECHIEQGPLLFRSGTDVGVVTGTQGISWQEIVVYGHAAHAGATPTEMRADAGLVAAEIVRHLRTMVDSGDYGRLRATVGHLTLHPGDTNIVPARADLKVDLRNPDEECMVRAEEHLARYLDRLQETQNGLRITTRRMARTSPVAFDGRLQKIAVREAEALGLTHSSILSGAGHDAQEMAAVCPAVMVFARGEYDGISHSPREYSTVESCARAINLLAATTLSLADEE